MRIAIFGMGYVGVVSGACFARLGHEVLGVDKNPVKMELLAKGIPPIVEEGIADLTREMVEAGRLRPCTDVREAVLSSDMSIISVGTPSSADGSLSLDAVRGVTQEIAELLRERPADEPDKPHIIVYRSTVLPGTCEDLVIPTLEEHSGKKHGVDFHVAFNPEFLREASSIKDFENPPFTIAGAQHPAGFAATRELYRGIEAEFVECSIKTAESVKYLCNIYHGLKVAFANEAGALLSQLGIDGREAMEIFCKDSQLNISKAYLRPGFAFGGSCLPKDLRAFLHLAQSEHVDLPLLRTVLPSNRAHLDRAFEQIRAHGRVKLALFGLAFKGGTDDLRESPIVRLAEKLLGKGYELRIYDPHVQTAKLTGANKAFIEKEIPHVDRLLQDSVEATLEEAELIVVANASRETVDEILRIAPSQRVIDLQSVPRLEELPGAYEGICW
ncbi:MAG: GDP-mannose dehydrogenase [Planctomycetota bacterium]|nr:MAG: GDP-mannose dehydrogenase [Planctomycetota bacterium]